MSASAVSFLPARLLACGLDCGLTVRTVFHDTRFANSAALATSMQQSLHFASASVQPVAGNTTRFWTHGLVKAWQGSPQPIAGVTGERSLFILEQLAREQRMRVLWQAVQDDNVLTDPASGANEKLVAWLIGPSGTV